MAVNSVKESLLIRPGHTSTRLGSQVEELQHCYVSPGSYLWTQGLYNCVDYAFFLFVGIVEGGGR